MKKMIFFCCICLFLRAVSGYAEGSKEQTITSKEAVVTSDQEEPYDFTLSVYGNANADDTIDEDDMVYVGGILDGVNESTQFADANYDGRIDDEDIAHIEAILEGAPVSITLIDNRGVTVTVDTPVTKIAALFCGALRPVLHLQAADRVAGIGTRIVSFPYNILELQVNPEIRDLPQVGTTSDPSQEALVLLDPDVILGTAHTDYEVSKIISQNTGIPFIYGNPFEECFSEDNGAYEIWRLISLILGKKERIRAEELIRYCDSQIHEVQETTARIPEKEKVRVILLCHGTSEGVFRVSKDYKPLDIAGGKNVAREMKSTSRWGLIEISPEQIISWDPDIILFHSFSKDNNYIIADEILSDPLLQTVSAIKNKRVYGTKAWFAGWDPATGLCECFYMAKLFYPELFKDMNVEAKGNEILEEFYKKPQLYDWMLENCGTYYTWRE
jgi:iron complex transport system substrate-binding protein